MPFHIALFYPETSHMYALSMRHLLPVTEIFLPECLDLLLYHYVNSIIFSFPSTVCQFSETAYAKAITISSASET
jgi:hypothetical protein